MPSIRIGLSTDFNLVGEQVGIGTTNPAARLDVAGQILADNTAGSGGVSTFREYQGFSQVQAKITNNTLIDNGSSGPFSSLSGEIKITGETTVSSGSTVEVGKTKTLTVTDKFAVPLGDTNSRDNTPEAGTTRFNQDFGTLEFFDGANWKTVNSCARYGAAGRGVIMGGTYDTPLGWSMEYVQIPTLGNSQYFGELEWGTYNGASFASATRGLYAGGRGIDTYDSGPITYSTAHVDSITIASRGNSTSWGTMSPGFVHTDSCSNSTRGLVAQGYPAHTTVYYVTIATEGEYGTFGNLTLGRHSAAGCASPTRGIFSGGRTPAVTNMNEIDVFTIASLGNAVEFGKLSRSRRSYIGSCSNSIRGIIMGGGVPNPIYFSEMEYITIATNGNGQDFGDLTINRMNGTATATQTRGIYAGGGNPTYYNVIDYISLTSLGNAQDFGDLTVWGERNGGQSVSDLHGGIGGF